MDTRLQETLVKEVMTKNVVTISSAEPITRAADKMLKSKIHGLVTLEGPSPAGIISTFDLLKIVFLKEYSETASVSSFSSKRILITIDIEATLSDAAVLMVENNIRTLPVMQDGQLAGIVSMMDVLKCVVG